MATEEEKFDNLLNSASKAADLILSFVKEEGTIHIASHFDADGLAAAGILGKALARLGGRIRVRIGRWIDERVVEKIVLGKPDLIIFADLGSGYLDLINEQLSNHRVLILDHHQPIGDAPSMCLQVNPHLYGIDGSIELCGAGITYMVAKCLDERNVELAYLAIVGALGDKQDNYPQRRFGAVNERIVKEAVKGGYLKVETDLLFFGRETRPINKALALTTNPLIPGISGNEGGSYKFLKDLGIETKLGDKWRALRDLSEEEKKKLFSALAEYIVSKGYSSELAMSLRGRVYTLVREEPWTQLRDAREFAVLLNATGRMDKPSLGVAICMGDRGKALEESMAVVEDYRCTIVKYLGWLNEKPERIEELNAIYVVHGGDYINDRIIGTISSMLSTNLPNPEKPIIAYSLISENQLAKISARTLEPLTLRGLNLGKILCTACEKHSGKGGGHNIAAGAQVPFRELEDFIILVDKLVKKQLGEEQTGG